MDAVQFADRGTRQQSLWSLAHGGRLLTYGATTNRRPETNIDRIFRTQPSVVGSKMAGPGEVVVVPDSEHEESVDE